jgi:hypothetical protein
MRSRVFLLASLVLASNLVNAHVHGSYGSSSDELQSNVAKSRTRTDFRFRTQSGECPSYPATYVAHGISSNVAAHVAIGEAQLTMTAFGGQGAGKALFCFQNGAGAQSTITDIYFDDIDGDRIMTNTVSQFLPQPGSDSAAFSSWAHTSSLPYGNLANFRADFSIDSDEDAVAHGIQAGQEYCIQVILESGKTPEDLLAHLNAGSFRVAYHVQNFGGSGSESFLMVPCGGYVPLPVVCNHDFIAEGYTNAVPSYVSIGESQFVMNVFSSGIGEGRVMFCFKNLGPQSSSITDIYFDDVNSGALLDRLTTLLPQTPGVSYGNWAFPSQPPLTVNPLNFRADKSIDSDGSGAAIPNGIGPNEELCAQFSLLAGKTAQQFDEAVASGAIKVGLTAYFGNSGSETSEFFIMRAC